MSDLALSIPLMTGVLVALAATAGAGYIVFGASLYLSAAADRPQQRRGQAAIRIGLAGLAFALAAFGLAELLIDPVAVPPASIEAEPFRLIE